MTLPARLTENFIDHASELFMQKTGMTRDAFNKLSADMKARAFTVSYVESVDKVIAIQNILDKAITEGTTLSKFRKDVDGFLQSTDWHKETVFRTNVQTAYGAAKWERAQDLRSLRPYARYSAVMDGRTRPNHAKLHGLVYPIDHPFWKTYWPPWDYNCRCHATTLSQMEIEENNITPLVAIPMDVPEAKDFTSPAQRGITIKPMDLLDTRLKKLSVDASLAVSNAVDGGIREIENNIAEKEELTW